MSNPEELLPKLALYRQDTTTNAHDGSKSFDKFPLLEEKVSEHTLTGQRLVSMNRVSDGVLSYDKVHMIFAVKSLYDDNDPLPMYDDNICTYTTKLYVMNMNTKDIKVLTEPKNGKSDHSPLWLDNETIAFLSNRSDSSQIWTIKINGGEAKQLSNYPLDIHTLKYNKTKHFLIFSTRIYPDCRQFGNQMQETKERDDKLKKRKANYHKYDRLFIRRWDEWYDHKRNHIFIQLLQKNEMNQWYIDPNYSYIDVMYQFDVDCPLPPFGGSENFDISPDGNELSYTANGNSDSSIAWNTNTHVYTISIKFDEANKNNKNNNMKLQVQSSVKCISIGNDGYDHDPIYSPNGKYIAYLSMKRAGYESDKNRIMIYNRETQQLIEQTPSWDISAASIIWQNDSNGIYIIAEATGRLKVFHLKELNSDKIPHPLIEDGFNSSINIINNNTLLIGRDSFKQPRELFEFHISTGELKQLTNFNKERLINLKLVDVEDFYFPGANNDQVHAFFFKPSDFNENEKYPLACVIHGGPQGAWDDHWHYRWNPQTLTTQGYAVICINFHGSSGYGTDFQDSINNDWGGKPYQDIMLGVDKILETYDYLDPKRICALGASYGGFMINWINGHAGDRFRCLVNHDGVFNQSVMYYATEELFFPEWEFGGPYYHDNTLYNKWSPHLHVEKWSTPTLVIHGGKDYRVLDVEGIGTFTALQRRGIPSEFLYFPDENHWVLNPANSIVWHDEVISWLKRWC